MGISRLTLTQSVGRQQIYEHCTSLYLDLIPFRHLRVLPFSDIELRIIVVETLRHPVKNTIGLILT